METPLFSNLRGNPLSEIISNAQKQQLKVLLPASVTIGSTTYPVAKKWSNQDIDSDITISVELSDDGMQTGIEDVIDGVLYYSISMTVHVIVKTEARESKYLHHGAHIADTIAQAVITTIKGWITPTSENVRIFNERKDVQPIYQVEYEAGKYDQTLIAKLYHS